MGSIADAAASYLRAGLCVLPAILDEKRPAVGSWKRFQETLPSEAQMSHWFTAATACCLLTGAISKNLEMIDFDFGGELFDRWAKIVESQAPGLLARLVMERSCRGGRHVIYLTDKIICGNLKLAQRVGPDGKPQTLIETRGEGGLFLCAPSPGYEILQGNLANPPVITEKEREILLSAAWSLNECWKFFKISSTADAVAGRPGDDFNARGDVRAILEKHGWTLAQAGDNEYWRRPGKDFGWSATLKNRVFYVFSSNAEPFQHDTGYSPFRVFALLEHAGDFAAAASALKKEGYGGEPDASGVDLSGITDRFSFDGPAKPKIEDPGPLPEELLDVPGFIREVMEYSLETAPYPSKVLAFCGALALQAFLAGRKVRDSGDNRTNIYLLGLAHSAAGKDHPRKVNVRIMHEAGLSGCLGERFASGEGIQDRLLVSPSMMYQTDEIDGILQSINKARDARHESIMTTLLTMYSSSNSVVPMRSKAGKEAPGVIDQPSLVVFGTAIPNHYYQALSERMLTNGFFARMIILEAGHRGQGREPSIRDLPQKVVETARWWADLCPGPSGNLEKWHPTPATVEQTADARDLLIETREETERQYDKAASDNDAVGTTVWGRVSEHVRKLALLYAVSENHQSPIISQQAVAWAKDFILHQTRRMLFMASMHAARDEFDGMCKNVIRVLRDWHLKEGPDAVMPPWILRRRLGLHPTAFKDVIFELEQRHEIAMTSQPCKTRPKIGYRLLRNS
ncbi:MAG: DUF3987 domain-containing protein [Planctomycetes bacterium]|nr:DUF3987 domain-containing protein [Planctomycetota bacterium]